jgi:hypothetical protein
MRGGKVWVGSLRLSRHCSAVVSEKTLRRGGTSGVAGRRIRGDGGDGGCVGRKLKLRLRRLRPVVRRMVQGQLVQRSAPRSSQHSPSRSEKGD